MTRRWLITDRGDPDTRALVDGADYGLRPPYSHDGGQRWDTTEYGYVPPCGEPRAAEGR